MRASYIRVTPKRIGAFAHDLVMTLAALLGAYFIRFGPNVLSYRLDEIVLLAAIVLPIAAVIYWAFGLYNGIWRFASMPDLFGIVKAVTIVTVIMAMLDFFTRGTIMVPRSVVAAYWFIQCALLGGPRMMFRAYRDQRLLKKGAGSTRGAIPVIIAGTGHESEVIIRRLETSNTDAMVPVALLAVKEAHVGQRIRRIPVMGSIDELESVVRRLTHRGQVPRRVIVTSEVLERERESEQLIATARRLGLAADRLRRSAASAPEGTGRIELAPIQIEDLLGRSTRELDEQMIRSLVEGQRVLVTGGGGTVGSELCRQIADMSCAELMIVENSEFALYGILTDLRQRAFGLPVEGRLCDVRNRDRIIALIAQFKPDLVFHAAALKHVPIVEHHLGEGIMTNTIGTVNVADASRAAGVRAMVLISTDKAVQPISVMGATKRAAESYCEALDALGFSDTSRPAVAGTRPTRFMSVRFGNVLGSSGSVVPLFQQQLESGGPLTITHPDMTRYFMTIKEAVSLVLMASALGLQSRDRVSIFVLDMGEPVRIVDLAERMIRFAGYEPGKDIHVTFTGIREGEKLHEELFDAGEPLRQTPLSGVLAAEPRPLVPSVLIAEMRNLTRAVRSGQESEMLATLSEIVPEYRPGPSVIAQHRPLTHLSAAQ